MAQGERSLKKDFLMFDTKIRSVIDKYLDAIAAPLAKMGIQAKQVTLTGFGIGLVALPLIALHFYTAALFCILINRLFDGLDGSIARQTRVTHSGAYLDIVLDFIFYSSVVFAFALAQPENAIYAALLILSFTGTGSSFLTFAIFAEKLNINSDCLVHSSNLDKSFHYLGGLAEGTETIVVLSLMCLFPEYFWALALGFSLICFLATILRIRNSVVLLNK